MASAIAQLDALIADTLSAWNIYTTLIAVSLVSFAAYTLIFAEDPDIHPLLLARQATCSPVRQPRESAVYRSTEIPQGYPLKSGLSVREPGAPKWSPGKDGDIRDVWREAIRPSAPTSASAPPVATILTVHGKDAPVKHDLADITKAINAIGAHLQKTGAQKVAIYLPNSIEYLATIFACAFYGLSPVLIPYNQPHQVAYQLLNDTQVQCVIASAGSLPLLDLCQNVPALRHVIWVVEPLSQHMDWQGTPQEAQGRLSVSVWHDLVEESSASNSELPGNGQGIVPGNVVTLWQNQPGGPAQIVEFTQKNMIAAVAALISALPIRQRFSSSDLLLPADSFSHSYVLALTLGALFSHSSLAINSVAGAGVDLALAARGIAPTVIIASNQTLVQMHAACMAGLSSGLSKMVHASELNALSAGYLPKDGLLSKVFGARGSSIGNPPGKLRLIFSSDRAGAESTSPTLSSHALNDLRIFTRSRICYALTAPSVAGAAAQTNAYDYRRDDRPGHNYYFGGPFASVELKLVNEDDSKVDGNTPLGEIVALGPAVVGGKAHLGVQGRFRADCTLEKL